MRERRVCVVLNNSLGCFLHRGVGHSGGGDGAFDIDALGALGKWVEDGVAPDRIIASKVAGGATTFTRPLCPYPALPRYTGLGDPTTAENFACVADRDDNQPPAPEYLDDGDNYPIVPIDARDRDHDHGHHYDNR